MGDGSVRRLNLTIGQINEAFGRSGNEAAAANPEPGDPNDTFIDLYVALATVPTIGRSLLGADGYEQLKARLQPEQQADHRGGGWRLLLQGLGLCPRGHL